MADTMAWIDVKACSDAELIAHRTNLGRFHLLSRVRERLSEIQNELDARYEVVKAQHEETGRVWEGPRGNLPPRYFELNGRDK